MKWLLLLVIVAQRLWFYWQFPLCAEDAYITFHAAIDPAWMKATTSPIYAFILSIGDPPTLARVMALAGDLVACWSVIATAPFHGAILFCLFWCTPFMSGSAISGLETHLVACALVAGLAWPLAYAFAGWRPDAIVMSLGLRWKAPLIAAGVFVLSGWLLAGSPLPQTVGSKLSTYGTHWFKGWYWWHSEGLGWLEVPLILGGIWGAWHTKQLRYLLVALAPLCLHWVLGTPNFWWYAVPSAAMLSALYCKVAGRKSLMIGAVAILLAWNPQWERFIDRMKAERFLWEAGEQLAKMAGSGTVFLEPAGMIPWRARWLSVIDEVGLVEPEVGKRREQGDGWMADVLRQYRPEWMVMRTRFLRNPMNQFTGRGQPFRNVSEAYAVLDTVPGYWIMAIATLDGSAVRYQSCDMAILQRKDLVTLPDGFKATTMKVVDRPPR